MKANNTTDMELFFTREAGDAGFKMDLYDPATGEDTKHWITIVSVDSAAFELADTIARRRTGEIQALKTEAEKALLVNDITRELIASLVTGWSFSMPPTKENVVAFLLKAPHIANAINTLSGKRSLFMRSNSPNSSDTPDLPLSSTESPKEVATPEEPT